MSSNRSYSSVLQSIGNTRSSATQYRFHQFWPFSYSSVLQSIGNNIKAVKHSLDSISSDLFLIVHCLSRNQTKFKRCFLLLLQNSTKQLPLCIGRIPQSIFQLYVTKPMWPMWTITQKVDQTRFPEEVEEFWWLLDEKTNKVKTLRNAKVLTLDQVSEKIFRLWSFLVMSKRLWPGHSSFFLQNFSPINEDVQPHYAF